MGRGKSLGDIVEIPLPNGLNAYGRVYKEYNIGIFNGFYKTYDDINPKTGFFRFIGLYAADLNKLKTVAKIPFSDDEDIWGPDQVVVDAISLKGSLYHHGEIYSCTYEECKDLEVVAAWHINHLVDMLMGDDKWDKSISKPIDI